MLKNYNINESIIHVLKDRRMMRAALVYKGDDELNFIKNLLNNKTDHLDKPVIHDTSKNLFPDECTLCPDITERKRPFGSGINHVMIILNSPRMANKLELSINRSESIDLLKKMVNAIGLEVKDCYVTNLIKCESASALIKPSDMVKNCISVLQKEIEIVKPKLAMVMGDILPLQLVVNSSRGITWFNTEHPISLLKNNELKRPAWETLKLMKKKYQELNDD